MKILLVGLAALAAFPALAQDRPAPPAGGGMGMMMRADTDGDGVITRAEAVAQATQRLERLDQNGDGKLTRDELERVGRAMNRMRGGGEMPPPPPPAAPPAN